MGTMRWMVGVALVAATVGGCAATPGAAAGGSGGGANAVRTDVPPCEALTDADLASLGLDPASQKATGTPAPSCQWRTRDSGSVKVGLGVLMIGAGSLDETERFGARPAPSVAGHRAMTLDQPGAGGTCSLAVELGDAHLMTVVHSAGGCRRMAELTLRNLAT